MNKKATLDHFKLQVLSMVNPLAFVQMCAILQRLSVLKCIFSEVRLLSDTSCFQEFSQAASTKSSNLIMMLLRARDNNIPSFAYIWLHKENQNEFLKHPKIKWLDG